MAGAVDGAVDRMDAGRDGARVDDRFQDRTRRIDAFEGPHGRVAGVRLSQPGEIVATAEIRRRDRREHLARLDVEHHRGPGKGAPGFRKRPRPGLAPAPARMPLLRHREFEFLREQRRHAGLQSGIDREHHIVAASRLDALALPALQIPPDQAAATPETILHRRLDAGAADAVLDGPVAAEIERTVLAPQRSSLDVLRPHLVAHPADDRAERIRHHDLQGRVASNRRRQSSTLDDRHRLRPRPMPANAVPHRDRVLDFQTETLQIDRGRIRQSLDHHVGDRLLSDRPSRRRCVEPAFGGPPRLHGVASILDRQGEASDVRPDPIETTFDLRATQSACHRNGVPDPVGLGGPGRKFGQGRVAATVGPQCRPGRAPVGVDHSSASALGGPIQSPCPTDELELRREIVADPILRKQTTVPIQNRASHRWQQIDPVESTPRLLESLGALDDTESGQLRAQHHQHQEKHQQKQHHQQQHQQQQKEQHHQHQEKHRRQRQDPSVEHPQALDRGSQRFILPASSIHASGRGFRSRVHSRAPLYADTT